MFDDIGLSEDEINNKYPEPSLSRKFKIYLQKNKQRIIKTTIISVVLVLTLFYLYNILFNSNILVKKLHQKNQYGGGGKFKQTGGEGEEGGEDGLRKKSVMSQISSPVSTTFGMVTAVISKFLKFLLLLLMIIMVPTIPILLYCLVAYFVIKKFLSMFTRLK